MKRKEYWQHSLGVYFDDVAHKSFKWGEHDCSLFAAGAVKAMTGQDFGEPFRGKYDDAVGAAKVLRDFGAGTLEKTVTAIFGAPLHVAQAKRGDVVMYQGALGICCGSMSRFIGTIDEFGQPEPADGTIKAHGLIPIPTNRCEKVWAVPF